MLTTHQVVAGSSMLIGSILVLAAVHSFPADAIAQASCIVEPGSWKPGTVPIKRTVTAQPNSVCNHGVYVRPASVEKTGIEVVHLKTAYGVSEDRIVGPRDTKCGTLRIKPPREGWTYEVTAASSCSGYFEVEVMTRDKNKPALILTTTFQYTVTVKP